VLITAGHRDVDQDVFLAIHNNGLVYNGRLIVDKSFQTTDPSIFAAGSLTEFSGRYMALS
jgi:thioredoxin reductase